MASTTTTVLGVGSGLLAIAGLVVATPVAGAAVGTAGLAVWLYSWAESIASDDRDERHADLLRVMRINNKNIDIIPLANYWNVNTSGISGAEAYVGANGGVGWIDMTSGNNYWIKDESFQPRQAKLIWVQDKSSKTFPQSKLRMK
jgi:hypothetical protein